MVILFTLLAVVALAFSAIQPIAAQAAPLVKAKQVEASTNGVYIVQMLDEPVVAYEGGIAGLAATAPQEGAKIDPLSATVTNYVRYLVGRHDQALKKAGGQKLYDYTYSYNGFAAKMNAQQAKKMAALDGVQVVTPDALQTMDTSSTPSFLGLDAAGGLWEQAWRGGECR